jgi:hypothetical protein
VEAAEAAEQMILARAGEPVVKLMRLRPWKRGIRLGLLKGRIPARLVDTIERPLAQRERRRVQRSRRRPAQARQDG